MTWLQYAIVAAVACITTMALVPPVKRLAFKIDAVDYPSERRVNKQPTARLAAWQCSAVFCAVSRSSSAASLSLIGISPCIRL